MSISIIIVIWRNFKSYLPRLSFKVLGFIEPFDYAKVLSEVNIVKLYYCEVTDFSNYHRHAEPWSTEKLYFHCVLCVNCYRPVSQLCLTLCNPMDLQDTMHPCLPPAPKVCPTSCPLHCWCHPPISSSDTLFSFCPQSFLASGTFPVSRLFASDDQNTGTSASPSILPASIQGWFPLKSTCLISLLSKNFHESSPEPQFEVINSLTFCLLCGPSLTTVHDHWEDHSLDYTDLSRQNNIFAFQYTA